MPREKRFSEHECTRTLRALVFPGNRRPGFWRLPCRPVFPGRGPGGSRGLGGGPSERVHGTFHARVSRPVERLLQGIEGIQLVVSSSPVPLPRGPFRLKRVRDEFVKASCDLDGKVGFDSGIDPMPLSLLPENAG